MNIAGVKNYGNHGSSARKSISHWLMMLAQLESDDDREKDFYFFIKSLYENMYENPEKYFISSAEYDEYVSKNKIDFESHKNDTKESKLRNTFQQAIHFYSDFFYQLGLAAEIFSQDILVISKNRYIELIKTIGGSYIRKENGLRLSVLAEMGIAINESGEFLHITCNRFPKMFSGLSVLCSAPESKVKYMNYLRLNYKGSVDIEDIKQSMQKNHAGVVGSLSKIFASENLKFKVKPLRSITSAHGWKVEYSLKGKNVFGFFAEPDYLEVYIYFNDSKNITEIAKTLEGSDAELFEWFCSKFPEKICKCRNNRAVMFGNEKRRICGLSNKAEIINPDENDVKIISKIQEKRQKNVQTH